MKKFKFFPLLLLFCLVLTVASPAAFALDDPSLGVGACVLADLNTGEILYSKNMDDRRSPASLTKVMTVLLAVEAAERGEVSLDDMVTAQSDCRILMEEDSSTSGIMPGEIMSLRDLMYCAMLQSANEACNIIGTHIAGSIDAFVQLMNTRAEELGCENTHFVTTNGLTAEGHYSSAHDMFLITSEAISHTTFMQMCNTLNYDVPATNMSEVRHLANSNALLTPDAMYNTMYGNNYVYEGAAGVKTGYTRAAGYCLLSTCERNGIRAIAVVMGCDGPLNAGGTAVGSFVDSRKLYDWLYNNFSYQTLVSSGEEIRQVEVQFAKDETPLPLLPKEGMELLLPNDLDMAAVARDITVYEDKLVAPISAGDVLGQMSIVSDGKSYGIIDLVAAKDVEMSRAEYIRAKITGFFGKGWILPVIIVVLVIAIIYLLLVARYKRLRRRYLREKRRNEQRRREERERMQEKRRIREEQEEYYRRQSQRQQEQSSARRDTVSHSGKPRSQSRDDYEQPYDNGYDGYGQPYDNGYDGYGQSYGDGYDEYSQPYDDGYDSYGQSYDNGYDSYGQSYDNGYDGYGQSYYDDGYDGYGGQQGDYPDDNY